MYQKKEAYFNCDRFMPPDHKVGMYFDSESKLDLSTKENALKKPKLLLA